MQGNTSGKLLLINPLEISNSKKQWNESYQTVNTVCNLRSHTLDWVDTVKMCAWQRKKQILINVECQIQNISNANSMWIDVFSSLNAQSKKKQIQEYKNYNIICTFIHQRLYADLNIVHK